MLSVLVALNQTLSSHTLATYLPHLPALPPEVALACCAALPPPPQPPLQKPCNLHRSRYQWSDSLLQPESSSTVYKNLPSRYNVLKRLTPMMVLVCKVRS